MLPFLFLYQINNNFFTIVLVYRTLHEHYRTLVQLYLTRLFISTWIILFRRLCLDADFWGFNNLTREQNFLQRTNDVRIAAYQTLLAGFEWNPVFGTKKVVYDTTCFNYNNCGCSHIP